MAPPSRKISAIDFDRVLQHVGPLGPWQYCHAFLLFLVSFLLNYNGCCSAVRLVHFHFPLATYVKEILLQSTNMRVR